MNVELKSSQGKPSKRKDELVFSSISVYLLQGLAHHQLTTYQKKVHGCSFQVDTKPLPNLGQLDDAEKAREEVAFSCIGIVAIAAWFAWQVHGLNIKIIYQVLRYQFGPQKGTYWNMWGFELNTSKMNHVVCGSKDLKLWYHRFLHGNVFAYGISTEAPPCAVHHLEPAAKGKQMVKITWQMEDIMIHHPPKRDALTHGRSWGSKFNHAMEQPKECCLVSLLREGMEDFEVLECKLETIRTTTYCILFPVINDDQCICLKPTSQRYAEFHNWDGRFVSRFGKSKVPGGALWVLKFQLLIVPC